MPSGPGLLGVIFGLPNLGLKCHQTIITPDFDGYGLSNLRAANKLGQFVDARDGLAIKPHDDIALLKASP